MGGPTCGRPAWCSGSCVPEGPPPSAPPPVCGVRKRRRTREPHASPPKVEPAAECMDALCHVPQDSLIRIAAMPVMLQRGEASKAIAARYLADVLALDQMRICIGMDLEEWAVCLGVFVGIAIRKWSAKHMRSLALTWRHFLAWSKRAGRPMCRGRWSGYAVASYLDSVDAAARISWSRRHAGRPVVAGAAAGATARGGRASRLRTLARDLHAPVDRSSLAACVAGRRQKRTGVRKRTLTERALVKLERLAAVGPTPAVCIRAAGFAA